MTGDKTPNKSLSHNPVIITAIRSMSLSKTYIVFAILIALVGIFVSLPSHAGAFSGEQLLLVPLTVMPTVLLVTPVLLLYVYDKNNGMLEYFLSLGMTTAEIFKRYLFAALIVVSIFLVADVLVNIAVWLYFGANLTVLLYALLLVVAISLSLITLMNMAMMAFSSLQKSRTGGNQPLGIAMGGVGIIPDYLIPFVLSSLSLAIFAELIQALIIAVLAIVMFFLSSKLISREKLLP
jgi:hypothetical protein